MAKTPRPIVCVFSFLFVLLLCGFLLEIQLFDFSILSTQQGLLFSSAVLPPNAQKESGDRIIVRCGPLDSSVDLTPQVTLLNNHSNSHKSNDGDFGHYLDKLINDPLVVCDSVRVDLNDYTEEQIRDLLKKLPYLVNKKRNHVTFVAHRAGASHVNNKLLRQLTDNGKKLGNIVLLEQETSELEMLRLGVNDNYNKTVELEFVFFTAVVLGYNVQRLHNMKSIFNVYLTHPGLHQLHYIWNNLNQPISFQQLTLGVTDENLKSKVQLRLASKNSLSNRFHPRLNIETNAIFVFDDDHVINLDHLSSLFKTWQQYPERLVGLVSRSFDGQDYSSEMSKSNIILPIKCFFDSKYLDEYWSWKSYELRQYVDHQDAHCDDIALNYIISTITGEPHILLAGMAPTGLRSDGALSSQKKRHMLRTECCAWISNFFGGKILPVVDVINKV